MLDPATTSTAKMLVGDITRDHVLTVARPRRLARQVPLCREAVMADENWLWRDVQLTDFSCAAQENEAGTRDD